MIIPYKTDLPLFGKPYISLGIIVICALVLLLSYFNETDINNSAEAYCSSIHDPEADDESLDELKKDVDVCVMWLTAIYATDDTLWTDTVREILSEEPGYSIVEINQSIALLKEHKAAFSPEVPTDINSLLAHDPKSLNPIPMITSSLAHADFEHLFFNALFFLAFAPALELIINKRRKYLATLTAISVITCLAYSLSVLITYSDPIPSIGLSGVVMGVIGLAGYLIPRANIGLIFWYMIAFKRFFIPAWIVATWYIGWDIYNMFTDNGQSGVDFVSHVAGGIGGYLIGVIYYAKEKSVLQDDLTEAIEEARIVRTQGKHISQYASRRREQKQRNILKDSKKRHDAHMDKVFKYVRTHRDSDAIVLLLEDYDRYVHDPVYIEGMFNRIMAWGHSRTSLCIGRMLIHILCQQCKYAWAQRITERCQNVTPEFVFADIEDQKMMDHYIHQSNESNVY